MLVGGSVLAVIGLAGILRGLRTTA
jgi:hypothetical protein